MIMEYTENENELIDKAFIKTRRDFEKDLDRNNDNDIVRAVLLFKNRYGMGAESHEIATEIFRKNGLWKNGKTTLEDHAHDVLQEKVEHTLKFNERKKEHMAQLREMQRAIEDSINAIERKPDEIMERMSVRRNTLRINASQKLEASSKEFEDKIKELITTHEKQHEYRKNNILSNLKHELEKLKDVEKQEVNEAFKEYDEYMKLQAQYRNTQERYEQEVENMKKQVEKTDDELFELTIRELKEIANENGIEVPTRILKAELVEIVKNM